MATNQVVKIYEVKSLGVDKLLNDFNQINSAVKAVDKSFLTMKADLARAAGNPEEVTRLTAEIKKLAIERDKLTKSQERADAELKTAQALREQEIANNNTIVVSYNELTGAIQTNAEAERQRSAAIQAGLPYEQEAAKNTLTLAEAEAALSAEREQIAANVTAAAEAQRFYNESKQETIALTEAEEERYIAVSERYVQLKVAQQDLANQMKLLEAQRQEGIISQEEYNRKLASLTEQQFLLKEQVRQATAELGIQAKQELAGIGSIDEMRARLVELRKERDSTNQSTAQGTVRVRELNAEINRLNVAINAADDALSQRKFNIGNYPTLAAELKDIRSQMGQLALAGEQDSIVFQQLSARAQVLTTTMAEVAVATKATAAATTAAGAEIEAGSAKIGGLAATASKTFGIIRQLAYILPGIGIAGIFSLLYEGIQKAADALINWATDADLAAAKAEKLKAETEALEQAQKDLAKSQANTAGQLDVLYTKSQDQTKSLNDRIRATKELQQLYPAYFKNLSTEAILAGEASDAYLALRDALVAKAAVQVYQDKYNESLSKEIDLTGKIDAKRKELASIPNQSSFTTGPGGVQTFTQGNAAADSRAVELSEELRDLESQRTELAKQRSVYLDKIEENTKSELKLKAEDKSKPVANAARDEFRGAKELNDAVAELNKQRIEQDAQANQQIFENEKETLEARLLAYDNYESDRIYQAEATRDKEIANAQAELTAVDKLLNDKSKKRTEEQTNSLLAQKKAANVKLQAATEAFEAAETTIYRQGAKDREAIVKSDIDNRIKGIDSIKNQAAEHAAEENAALRKAYESGNITYKEFKDKQKLLADQEHLYELKLIKKYLEEQIAAFKAAGRDTTELEGALTNINTKILEANDQLANGLKKQAFDIKGFYNKLKEAALDAAKTIADGYIEQKQRQIDKDLQAQEKALDIEKQKKLDAATTAEEKAAIEQEYATKQEALEKKAFEEHKKQAKAQLGIEFAIASMKAINRALSVEGAGIYEALAAEALVAIEYAASLAVLEQQKYAKGGQVMKLGAGRVNASQNIPTQSNGDNVLATVRVGEVILNEQQQKRAGGAPFFRALGVPGFATGGYFGSQVQPPVFSSQVMRPVAASADFSQEFSALRGMISDLYAAVATEATKPVVLNPNAVTTAQSRNYKAVDIGTL